MNSNRTLLFSLSLFIISFIVLRLGLAYHEATAGYAPMIALLVLAAFRLPLRVGLAACAVAYLLSDVLINTLVYQGPALTFGTAVYAALMLGIFAFAFALRRPKFPVAAGLTVAGALVFYLAANTFAWIAGSGYAMNAAGWWQAQTVGLPGFPPAYHFFRAMLVGNLVFLVLAWPLVSRMPRLQTQPVAVAGHGHA